MEDCGHEDLSHYYSTSEVSLIILNFSKAFHNKDPNFLLCLFYNLIKKGGGRGVWFGGPLFFVT